MRAALPDEVVDATAVRSTRQWWAQSLLASFGCTLFTLAVLAGPEDGPADWRVAAVIAVFTLLGVPLTHANTYPGRSRPAPPRCDGAALVDWGARLVVAAIASLIIALVLVVVGVVWAPLLGLAVFGGTLSLGCWPLSPSKPT